MAEMRGGEGLSRAAESYQKIAEMRGKGGVVESCRKLPK